MQERVDLTMVTFSKSFASIGGAVSGPESVIHYLRHHGRPLIFSASMPPSAVATVLACLDVMEREPERRARLWENADYLRSGLQSLGFDTATSETPIIPVASGNIEETFVFWRRSVRRRRLHQPGAPARRCRALVPAAHLGDGDPHHRPARRRPRRLRARGAPARAPLTPVPTSDAGCHRLRRLVHRPAGP
jgi:hypothetical protein